MSLFKFGSQTKILRKASSIEGLLLDKPVEAAMPKTSIISPVLEDHLFYRARAISAGDQGPMDKNGERGHFYNGNYDYFPRAELEKACPSFISKNIFLDHNSESSLYSVGKILDSYPVEDPETGEFYLEILGRIDRKLHPEICRKIETGELNSTSMGCSVDDSMCSICGNVLHSDADEKCVHMGMNLGKKFPAEINLPEYNIHKGEMVPCFSINSGIQFSEDSIVGVPADSTAVIKSVIANMRFRLSKKASLTVDEQTDFVKQFENLLTKVDSETSIKLKAEFCGICPPIKESSMPETNLTPNEDTKKILSKLSALEMEQLESYVAHKTKKANEIVNKEVVADAASKEETFLSKIVAKVKDALTKEASKYPCPKCKSDNTSGGELAQDYSLTCKNCGYEGLRGKTEKENLSWDDTKVNEFGKDSPTKEEVTRRRHEKERSASISAKVKNSFAAELLEKKIETVAKEEMGKEAGSDEERMKEINKKLKGPLYDKDTEEVKKLKDEYWKLKEKKSSLSAKFNEDTKNVLASTWSIYNNGSLLIEASLKDIWGAQFALLSFADQKWATSEDYAKEAVSRLMSEGLPKLADLWDVSNKIKKTATNGEFFKASNFFVGGSDSANNWKAEDIKKWDEKDGHVVTEYTFKFAGQEDSKGQVNSSVMTVKTEYGIKRPEGSDFVAGSDSSNNYKVDEVKAADEGNKGGYGHVKTEYSFKRQPGKEFVGGSDSSNTMTPDEIKRASLKTAEEPWCANGKCNHYESQHMENGGSCEMGECPCKEFKKASLKTASEPKLGPDGSYATQTTGLSNKKHDYPTTPKFTDPKPGTSSKGPAAPAHQDMKVDYKIDFPGQEKGQTGPAAPKPMAVKTDYSEPKPEAEGKEVKTTPKNPDEKDAKKSEKEVKTDYVAKGTEEMEDEESGKVEKADKKSYKEQNGLIKWSAMSPEGQAFIKKHVEKHMDEDGMEKAQAVAAAYSEARKKGFEVPSKASSQETIMEKKAENTLGTPEEAVQDKPELSKKTMGDKAEQCAQGETEPKGTDPKKAIDEAVKKDAAIKKEAKCSNCDHTREQHHADTEMGCNECKCDEYKGSKKEASDKPTESVDGSTLPEGKKKFDAKPDESVKGSTLPEEGHASKPETSAQGDKEHKTPNLTKAPDQAVDGNTIPHGKKDEESVETSTHPDGKKSVGTEPDMAVNKKANAPCEGCGKALEQDKVPGDFCGDCLAKNLREKRAPMNKKPSPLPEMQMAAATEMPTPEMKDEVKVEEKPMDLPMGEHSEMPKGEEVSAFDVSEKLDIGSGYSAHKDHESKEVIIEKDGKEVKRLPDGFGKDVAAVLPLMKAVLGLPAEEVMPAASPDMAAPKMEEKKDEMKVEEHPALEEAHEDEMGIKESALKVKEAELLKKEAALKVKEDAVTKEEASKKFASVLQARSERCRKIVAELIEKEQLSLDKNVYESELKNGSHLLDARKKAFEAAIVDKQKEFLALNDDALLVMEATIKSIKAPTTETNTKKANRLFVSPQYNEQMSEDEEISKIFKTMGNFKQRPQ